MIFLLLGRGIMNFGGGEEKITDPRRVLTLGVQKRVVGMMIDGKKSEIGRFFVVEC